MIGGYAPFGLAFFMSGAEVFAKEYRYGGYAFLSDTDFLMDPELALRYITACVVYEIFLFIIDRNSPPNCYITGAAAAGILAVCGVERRYCLDLRRIN